MDIRYFASRPSSPTWVPPPRVPSPQVPLPPGVPDHHRIPQDASSTVSSQAASTLAGEQGDLVEGKKLNARLLSLSNAAHTLERLCIETSTDELGEFFSSWKYTSGQYAGTLQPNALAWFNASYALANAVSKTRVGMVQSLLAEGIKPNGKAFGAAIGNINTDDGRIILTILFEAGWDINTPLSSLSASLLIPVLHDDTLVTWCLSRGADPNATSPSNRTVLHCAASFGAFASLRLLVDAGGSFAYPSPSEDIVACAVLRKTEPDDRMLIISFLIERGANLSAYYLASRTQPTGLEGILGQSAALHLAVMYNYQDIVELLVRGGADVQQRAKNVLTKGEWLTARKLAELLELDGILEVLDNFEAETVRK